VRVLPFSSQIVWPTVIARWAAGSVIGVLAGPSPSALVAATE
jgi:hypothetical protein